MSPTTFNAATQAVFITDHLAVDVALQRYQQRRTAFLATCTHVTLLVGIPDPVASAYSWLEPDIAYYQEPVMAYFTGLNQVGVALLFNPFTKTTTLFLPKDDPNHTFWEGHRFGCHPDTSKDLALYLRVDDIEDIKTLYAYCDRCLREHKSHDLATLWYEAPSSNTSSAPHIHDMYLTKKEELNTFFSSQERAITLHNCNTSLTHRLSLDKTDIKNLNIANTLTTDIFKQCCNLLHTFTTETQVAGFIKGAITQASALGESFPAIVACGDQAAILHYHQHNQPLEPGRLLLLDFGCRYYNVPADISRTIPVNGKFNPLQRLLYTLVLEAQVHVESMLKPGITIQELNTACWHHMETNLKERFINQGGTMTRAYTHQPHNVSHLIAHAVHDGDPTRAYRTMPLQPGMVISNEPGLYGTFSITLDGTSYHEKIGIRIEDDLCVTETGCENLSADCPKTVEDIEALMRLP